jgi:hypothetical protein
MFLVEIWRFSIVSPLWGSKKEKFFFPGAYAPGYYISSLRDLKVGGNHPPLYLTFQAI